MFSATWQRCRVHFARNAMAHAGKSGRRVVSAFIATAYAQETPEAARGQWRKVADQLRPSVPKLAKLMDTAEEEVLAYMAFSPQHRTKLHSTNPLERLNGEIKRRTGVVGKVDDLVLAFKGIIGEQQQMRIAYTPRRGLRGKATRGGATGGRVLGYRRAITGEDVQGRELDQLAIDDKQVELVRRIFRLYAEG